MKSIISYLGSILLIILFSSAVAQDKGRSNSIGETIETQKKSSSSEKSYYDTSIDLENDIKRKNKRIKSLYFFEQEVLDSYGGGTQTITKSLKKTIYKTGQKLIEVENERIEKLYIDDFENKTKSLKEIERVQDQLLYLSGKENTRQFEKKLKKLKTVELIRPVFFQKIE